MKKKSQRFPEISKKNARYKENFFILHAPVKISFLTVLNVVLQLFLLNKWFVHFFKCSRHISIYIHFIHFISKGNTKLIKILLSSSFRCLNMLAHSQKMRLRRRQHNIYSFCFPWILRSWQH